jgi:hypothetical protein
MNLLTMQQRLQRRTNGNDSSIPSGIVTKWKDYLNEAHKSVLRMPGMDSLRYGTMSFASVASQQAYALPTHGIARINRIWETTNDIKLQYRTLEWLRSADPDPVTGTPCVWIPTGFAEVHTQPSAATSVYVDSTSASDTNTAYVEGIVTGGYSRSASVVMMGTQAVQIGTATDFIAVTKFYLSAAAAGTVTLQTDGGTEFAAIAVGDTRSQYYRFLLYPTPSAVVTYTCDITRTIPEMTNDTDEPLLPDDFHDLLIDMAELKNTKKSDDPSRYAMLVGEIKRATADLRTFINDHPDYTPPWLARTAAVVVGGVVSAWHVVLAGGWCSRPSGAETVGR